MLGLFTIGHSSHSAADFISLLEWHDVTAIADVRSHPYSRYNPQFRKNNLESILRERGIAYVFLGAELGARSNNPHCYVDGRVQYSRLAAEPSFATGIQRVLEGARRYNLALLCAEREPLDCHRTILVCRELRGAVDWIHHLHADGSVETHTALEARLMCKHNLSSDMLTTREECIEQAYDRQAKRIAYVNPAMR